MNFFTKSLLLHKLLFLSWYKTVYNFASNSVFNLITTFSILGVIIFSLFKSYSAVTALVDSFLLMFGQANFLRYSQVILVSLSVMFVIGFSSFVMGKSIPKSIEWLPIKNRNWQKTLLDCLMIIGGIIMTVFSSMMVIYLKTSFELNYLQLILLFGCYIVNVLIGMNLGNLVAILVRLATQILSRLSKIEPIAIMTLLQIILFSGTFYVLKSNWEYVSETVSTIGFFEPLTRLLAQEISSFVIASWLVFAIFLIGATEIICNFLYKYVISDANLISANSNSINQQFRIQSKSKNYNLYRLMLKLILRDRSSMALYLGTLLMPLVFGLFVRSIDGDKFASPYVIMVSIFTILGCASNCLLLREKLGKSTRSIYYKPLKSTSVTSAQWLTQKIFIFSSITIMSVISLLIARLDWSYFSLTVNWYLGFLVATMFLILNFVIGSFGDTSSSQVIGAIALMLLLSPLFNVISILTEYQFLPASAILLMLTLFGFTLASYIERRRILD